MIYLLGGTGYVGQAFQQYFCDNGVNYKSISRKDIDYSDANILLRILKSDRPEFLINAAGYTGKPNVDACESQRAECLFGNAILPARVGQACAAAGIPWGHVSSGCIYSGCPTGGRGFTENDAPNFTFRSGYCSFYSGSKALGEEILSGMPDMYIWRLRIPFDNRESPRNYLTKIMRYDRLLDATNSISQLQEFVSAAFSCWKKRVPFGIYNVINPGAVTTRQVVQIIKSEGILNKDYHFFNNENEFMQFAAKTPRSNCVLSSDKLASVGIKMTDANEAIRRDLRRWRWAV
jgi:dTDP-4-dehydrorhamnose reductase